MKNKFSQEIRFIMQEAYMCWYCGQNTADCLHHIVGRKSVTGKVESSILNSAPLCNHKCHLPNHGKLMTDEFVIILLNNTIEYLNNYGYELKQIDLDFIEKYKQYYKKTPKQ